MASSGWARHVPKTAPGLQAQMDYSSYDIVFTAEGRRRIHAFSYVWPTRAASMCGLKEVTRHPLYPSGITGQKHTWPEHVPGRDHQQKYELLKERFAEFGGDGSVKKQQMPWTQRGTHLLLQTRTKVFNDELEAAFRPWYPLFRAQAKAA